MLHEFIHFNAADLNDVWLCIGLRAHISGILSEMTKSTSNYVPNVF